MPKMRVFKLAKELKVQSALILEVLERMGQEVPSDLSTLEPGVAEQVRVQITTALNAEKQRLAAERAAAEKDKPEPVAEPEQEAPPADVGEQPSRSRRPLLRPKKSSTRRPHQHRQHQRHRPRRPHRLRQSQPNRRRRQSRPFPVSASPVCSPRAAFPRRRCTPDPARVRAVSRRLPGFPVPVACPVRRRAPGSVPVRLPAPAADARGARRKARARVSRSYRFPRSQNRHRRGEGIRLNRDRADVRARSPAGHDARRLLTGRDDRHARGS